MAIMRKSKNQDSQCRLVQQWLPGYLRLELTAVRQRQIQAHLASCDRCARRLQEARLLAAELQTEADRYQPRLSTAASRRIQNQVYRRMQRSLAWQRTGHFLRLGTAFFALILVLAGSFLFGGFWVTNLTVSETATAPGETNISAAAPQPQPTVVPTAPPRPVGQSPEAGVPDGHINAWDQWTAVTPGETPEELAETIVRAALAKNELLLFELFVGMGANRQPTANLWLSAGSRCHQELAASDFEFIRRPIPLPTVTSVSLWYAGHQVGEIKMRQVGGDWFATFTRIPSVNPCLFR